MYKKRYRKHAENIGAKDAQLCQEILDSIKNVKSQKRSVLTKDNTRYLYYKPGNLENSSSTVQTVIKNQADGYMKPYFNKTSKEGRQEYYYNEGCPTQDYEYQVQLEPDLYQGAYDTNYEEADEYDQMESCTEGYYMDEEKYKTECIQNYIQYVQNKNASIDTLPDSYNIDSIPVRDHNLEAYLKPNPFIPLKSSTEFGTETSLEPIKREYVTVSRFIQTDPVTILVETSRKNRWTQTNTVRKKSPLRMVRTPESTVVPLAEERCSFTTCVFKYSRIILLATVFCNIIHCSLCNRYR